MIFEARAKAFKELRSIKLVQRAFRKWRERIAERNRGIDEVKSDNYIVETAIGLFVDYFRTFYCLLQYVEHYLRTGQFKGLSVYDSTLGPKYPESKSRGLTRGIEEDGGFNNELGSYDFTGYFNIILLFF